MCSHRRGTVLRVPTLQTRRTVSRGASHGCRTRRAWLQWSAMVRVVMESYICGFRKVLTHSTPPGDTRCWPPPWPRSRWCCRSSCGGRTPAPGSGSPWATQPGSGSARSSPAMFVMLRFHDIAVLKAAINICLWCWLSWPPWRVWSPPARRRSSMRPPGTPPPPPCAPPRPPGSTL